MSDCLNLIGLPYLDGKQDCYSVVRRYYEQEWGVELPNLARPDRFWEDPALDLYGMYKSFGFYPLVDNEPFEIGDAVLMPILSAMNNHAGVIVGDNEMLHHPTGGLSRIDPIRPKWINRITIHLRHPKVAAARRPAVEQVHLHEVIDAEILRDPRVQEGIARAVAARG